MAYKATQNYYGETQGEHEYALGMARIQVSLLRQGAKRRLYERLAEAGASDAQINAAHKQLMTEMRNAGFGFFCDRTVDEVTDAAVAAATDAATQTMTTAAKQTSLF